MHLLGCLIMLVLLAFVFILIAPMILLNFVRKTFGIGTKNKNQHTHQQNNSGQKNNTAHTQRKSKPNSRQRRSKIFEKHEGEYVDFIEVKE